MNFNTTRFVDVSTTTQQNNGTTVFHDTDNPGVFYASYASGNVRRIIQTTTQTSSPADSTSSSNTVSYPINHRNVNAEGGNNFVAIRTVSGRLARIAEMADKLMRDAIPLYQPLLMVIESQSQLLASSANVLTP